MYLSHFRLDESPFAITPDPRFLYLSDRYREALAHLVYGADHAGGFVQLTGEVGTGKTMIGRAFLAQLPEGVDAALVLNPKVTAAELMRTVLEELQVALPEADDSTQALVEALNRHLLEAHARGRRTVLMIDEAQNLSAEVLEQVRLLTNLETERHKLLQIFLIGQPELRELLAARHLRQVAQRITARYHLTALTADETRAYVEHRLRIAGATRPLFTRGALREVYRRSRGVPRLVNVICDRAMLGAYATDQQRVTARVVRRAAAELKGGPPRRRVRVAAALGLTGAVFAAAWAGQIPAVRSALEAAFVRLDTTDSVAVDITHASKTSSGDSDAALMPAAYSASDTPAYVRLQQALRAEPESRDRVWAERALLAMWGVAPDADADLCRQADQAGLRCMEGEGGWDDVRRLGRPAIVEFRDGSVRRFALLTGADGETITARVGKRSLTLSVTEFDSFWHGDYQLLWRPPLPDGFIIGDGSTPEAIAWLRDRLGLSAGTEYDPALRNAVRQFQHDKGLKVDGIAGPRTLVHLIGPAGGTHGDPRLMAHKAE